METPNFKEFTKYTTEDIEVAQKELNEAENALNAIDFDSPAIDMHEAFLVKQKWEVAREKLNRITNNIK